MAQSTSSGVSPAKKDAIYSSLPPRLVEAFGIQSGPELTVDEIVADLVGEAKSSSSAISAKLENKVLSLDNPQKRLTLEEVKQKTFVRKTKNVKRMSSRQMKQNKLFEIQPEFRKYIFYIPLHELWKQYIDDLLGISPSVAIATTRLLKADLHGAALTVVRAKCPSYIDVKGILIQETERTFKVITENDELKMILKEGTIFTLELRSLLITIYGGQFLYRSSERSKIKWKAKPTIEL